MPLPNYTLKLTLKQANIVRRALEDRKDTLEEEIHQIETPGRMDTTVSDEHDEIVKLLQDL